MMRCDALVIGGGLSARRCAEIISEKYNTILIHDGGGASPYIHGICIPLDPSDSLELFIEDTLKSGKYQNNKALVRTLCEGALALADEFEFDRYTDGSYDLLRPLGASVGRVASIREHTGAYIMSEIASRRRFTECAHTRALRLIEKNGAVFGALCYHTDTSTWEVIYARTVILATGGFGGVFPFSTNSSDIGGDGIAMAYLAGGELCDMEFIQFEPTAALSPAPLRGKSVITTMLYEGATFRNRDGMPFLTCERVDKDILSKEIYREILRGGATKDGGVYYDATGVDSALLKEKYKSYYERYLRVGVDITREMMVVAPAPHTTLGGVVIDSACHSGVKGLFAVGEVIGGLHGANRLGGNAGLETLVFGKIAGESATKFLDEYTAQDDISKMEEYEEIPETDIPFARTDLHERVRSIAAESLGVVRAGERMKQGREELAAILDTLRLICEDAAGHSYGAYRAYNDALTISLALDSALAREGSVGAHEREDAVVEDERYTVFLSREYGLKKEKLV